MVTPLLTTKLYIPPPLPNLVKRPRLAKRLDEGLRLGHRMTLVSAPAGFGKTTLVSEWIAQVSDIGDWGLDAAATEQTPIPNPQYPKFAWLSLDEGDNDSTCFLAYLIAALQTVVEAVGNGVLSALQSPQPPPTEAVLTSLINEVAAVPDRIILVFDDYHLIKVLGELDESWSDWTGRMTIAVNCEGDGPSITTLTGSPDQAALQGLLRRLYSLGLPLISVYCVEFD